MTVSKHDVFLGKYSILVLFIICKIEPTFLNSFFDRE